MPGGGCTQVCSYRTWHCSASSAAFRLRVRDLPSLIACPSQHSVKHREEHRRHLSVQTLHGRAGSPT